MKQLSSILVFLVVVVVATLSSSSSIFVCDALSIAPTFDLHLDQPAILRWYGAIDKILALHSWEDSFGPLIDYYNATLYMKLSNDTRLTLETAVRTRYPEHYLELQGLVQGFARAGHSEVSLNYLCFWVWFHELDHANSWGASSHQKTDTFHKFENEQRQQQQQQHQHRDCTGVIVAPEDLTAPFIHGRNLDQSIHPARNLTLQVKFFLKGKLVFTCTDFYWLSSGLVTCQQNNGVTLEENWRYNHPTLTFEQIMSRIVQTKTVPQVLMFRILLQQNIYHSKSSSSSAATTTTGFDQALSFFNNSQFCSPWFGIMTGYSEVNQSRSGSILSISFDKSHNNIAIMNDITITQNSLKDDYWFLVQTNYDRWLPDPPSDPRRTVAEETLKMLGREEGATKLGVWQTISTYPVHNVDTFYSVIMSSNETSRGFIRRSMVPSK